MDSTEVASNTARLGRVRLLARVMRKMYRALDTGDQEGYADRFGPYRKDAKRLTYGLRADESRERIEDIGSRMVWLAKELRDKYSDSEAYEILLRVLKEHFEESFFNVIPRRDCDVDATSLQSPSDPEATYRRKSGKSFQGYVANVAETCDEDNDCQLIVVIQVESNCADDAQLMVEAADSLSERAEVDKLYTDGGYNSLAADDTLTRLCITQVQTGIRGKRYRYLGRDTFD